MPAQKLGHIEKKPWKRQTRTKFIPELKNVLWGKLLYLRMVRGKDDLIYTRLAERYNTAIAFERSRGTTFDARVLSVEPVVRDHKTAEEAVFVVEWLGDYQDGIDKHAVCAQGSAFVYRERNLILTCDHVFDAKVDLRGFEVLTDFDAPEVVGKTLNLVRPGTKESWPAKIVYRSRSRDFAILQFEGDIPEHRYFAAIDAPIEVRSDGFLIGFPAYKHWNSPDQNPQKVLNRTFPHPKLPSFTITGAGSIRPGNSGGPFTDTKFRVAGMAQKGAYMGTGHDECLCFEVLDSLIEQWKSTSVP